MSVTQGTKDQGGSIDILSFEQHISPPGLLLACDNESYLRLNSKPDE